MLSLLYLEKAMKTFPTNVLEILLYYSVIKHFVILKIRYLDEQIIKTKKTKKQRATNPRKYL